MKLKDETLGGKYKLRKNTFITVLVMALHRDPSVWGPNPDKFDPRDYLKPAREAAKGICKQRYLEFGCEGQAAKIKAVALPEVARRYASGELAQLVQ